MKYIKKLILEREFKSSDNITLGKFNNYNTQKNAFYSNLNKFKEKLQKLMQSNKLEFEYNDRKEILFFTGDIMTQYKELIKMYKKLYYVRDDRDENSDDPYFYITIEWINFNRIHFAGIPTFLKGINLGNYIYKYVAKKFHYISSEGDASNEVKSIWNNLIHDKDFYSFYVKFRADDYKVGIIYKPYLNEVKKEFITYLIENDYSRNAITLDSKLIKDLSFVDELKYSTEYLNHDDKYSFSDGRYIYLNLYDSTVAVYNKKLKTWKNDFIFKKGPIYDVVMRDVNRFIKKNKITTTF